MPITNSITACIPTVNRPAELAVALASLLGQALRPYRVLIALDGTNEQQDSIRQDGLIRNLAAAFKTEGIALDFISNPGPHGIGQVKNYYIRHIESPWFLQVEDDAWLAPDYVARLAATRAFHDARTAGVAGVQLLPELPKRAGWSDHDLRPQTRAPELFNELRVTPRRVDYLNKGQCYRYSPSVLRQRQQIHAQCFLHTYCLRTEAVRQLGGWDLQFSDPARSFAFEEVDATYSLYMAGYDLYVVPGAAMWHLRSSNRSLAWRYDAKRVRAGYKINERLFIRKWLGKERIK